MKLSVILFFIYPVFATFCYGLEREDAALAEKLKQELNFNQQRRLGFKKQVGDQKIFAREREKGLALFLEEQEKFDLAREKGIYAYKNSKTKSVDESSPDYFLDLKVKKQRDNWIEEARKAHVKTRDQIVSQYSHQDHQSEMEELDLNQQRPRYDLRKRYHNKWIKNGGKPAAGSSSGAPFSGAPTPDNTMDFPAPIDYSPQPLDNFEDIPPPPPPLPFDQNQGFDSGFGDSPMPPPPPPPPEGGWDF